MGLDQYAYVANRGGQNREFWEGATYDDDTQTFENKEIQQPREIAYWRKHPNLQGWMNRLWQKKGYPGSEHDLDLTFNGVELELEWGDIVDLEQDILRNRLSPDGPTTGFFFGNPSDEYYREHDLEFVAEAKFWLFNGGRVFYNSSW